MKCFDNFHIYLSFFFFICLVFFDLLLLLLSFFLCFPIGVPEALCEEILSLKSWTIISLPKFSFNCLPQVSVLSELNTCFQ